MPLKDFRESYSGFAVLIAKNQSAFPVLESEVPDLRLDAYNFDFGFIEQGERARHTFALQNRGDKPLVLSSVDTSCSCTQASLPKEQTLPPGCKGELVVGFDSTGRNGRQSQTVYLHSNDPITPIVELQITGTVKPTRLPISVRQLNLGIVKKRVGATGELSIADPGDRSLAVTEVVTDSPHVKASLTRTDKQGLVYLVRVELQPGAPMGQLRCKITVRSNHPKEPAVEIPVTAVVIGDVEASPMQFFLGVVKRGHGASATATVLTTGGDELRIQRIESPSRYITVKSQAEVENRRYALTATLSDAAPRGLIEGDVVVHTDNSDQPEIKIPVYALVE